jgi:hypothetical protein
VAGRGQVIDLRDRVARTCYQRAPRGLRDR